MKLRIIGDTTQPASLKYPCLMSSIADKKVVLFSSQYCGTVIAAGLRSPEQPMGHYSSAWVSAESASSWIKFTDVIELSN